MSHKKSFLEKLSKHYKENYQLYLDHMQQFNHLLILLNISFFFVTELVIKENYYFTYFSLAALGLIQLLVLLPFRWIKNYKFYLFLLFLMMVAGYFFIASVVYWVKIGGCPSCHI